MTATLIEKDPLVYAFWKHTQFPYFRGDQGRLLPDGNFKAHGYAGATFPRSSLIAIYPVGLGQKLMDSLGDEKDRYYQAVQALNTKYRDNFIAILPELCNLKELE